MTDKRGEPAPSFSENGERKPARNKLSFAEAKEFKTVEERIAAAEKKLLEQHAMLENPAVTSDAALLRNTCLQIEETQKIVETLYLRWAALEKKAKE